MLTIRPFTGYFVRRHKQLRHIMLIKITCNRTRKLAHSHKRKSLSLFQSDYIQLQSVVTSWKHTVQAVPSKKKDGRSLCGRKRKMENDTWKKRRKEERENERKEKERKEVEKRRRRKGMERVCAEGKGKGRMRCGRKEERKEKDKKGEEEEEE